MFIEIFNWVNISSDVSSRLTWFKASVGLEVLTGGSSDWEEIGRASCRERV